MSVKKQRWTSKVSEAVLTILRDKQETLSFDTNELSEEMKQRLMLHGLSQKVKDSVAGQDKKGATIEDQVATMNAVWERLLKNDWATRKTAEPTTTLRGAVKQVLGLNLPEEQEKQSLKMVFTIFGASAVHEKMVEQLREELEEEENEG